MKTWIKNLLYAILVSGFYSACTPEIDVPTAEPGSANFTKYVAVGNSLTAGYSDGGLYADVQRQSFPMLIAQQMNEITPINFVQPDIPGNGSGYLYVTSLDLSTSPPAVAFDEFDEDPGWKNQLEGPFNNLGVPGIRVKDIAFAGYGTANSYFNRMLGGESPTATYLEIVQKSQPTFFTSWLGNNDVLGYASSGGIFGVEGQPGTGIGGITDPDTEFKPLYDALIAALTSGGGKGVVLTVPDVTLAPFFTTIPWNGAVLDDATATLANQFYSAGIDTAVESRVQEAVIELTVTQTALSENVIPIVASGTVYQQTYAVAYAQAIAAGATPEEADSQAQAAADAFIVSAEGQAAVAALQASLDVELQNHLLGDHTNHEDLEPVYAFVDQELAENQLLQAGIAQGIQDLTLAYENELLPPAQQAALDAAIAQGTQDQIAALQAAGIYPVFQAGPNAFMIEVPVDETNPLGIRQMREGEFILLTALLDGELEGTNALIPKPDQYILTTDEVANITSYTEEFNQIIRSYASSPDIALVETNDVLAEVQNGMFVDGVSVNGDFLTGGAFSLDGVHLTPRGYSLVANAIIASINSKFNSSISPVNISNQRAVVLP